MSLFQNAIHFPAVLSAILRNIKRQHQFMDETLGLFLKESRQNSDGTLDNNDYKKITGYYGLAVPAILGESICTLRGKPMTDTERRACTYQGAFTGLFDDFIDKQGMKDETMIEFINRPALITPSNSSEELFLFLFQKAREYYCNPELSLDYLRKVYLAQAESRKQGRPGLTQEEIKRITIDKGGFSVLFYRSVFAHPFLPGEEAAFHQLGGLMQLGNDIFDIYKDYSEGIETLITGTSKVKEVRELFKQMSYESLGNFYHLGYDRRDVKKFIRLVSLSLCSRCYVCLDQLEKLEVKSGHRFIPGEYSREQLICDMDTPLNKWRSIRHFLRSGL